VAYVGFQNIGAMSRMGCRPFDRARDGMTASEGGVAYILARSDMIPQDEARVRVAGASYNCDAQGIVEPSAAGLEKIVFDALRNANLSPPQIDAVYWHGTGTRRSDAVEAVVAKALWGK